MISSAGTITTRPSLQPDLFTNVFAPIATASSRDTRDLFLIAPSCRQAGQKHPYGLRRDDGTPFARLRAIERDKHNPGQTAIGSPSRLCARRASRTARFKARPSHHWRSDSRQACAVSYSSCVTHTHTAAPSEQAAARLAVISRSGGPFLARAAHRHTPNRLPQEHDQ